MSSTRATMRASLSLIIFLSLRTAHLNSSTAEKLSPDSDLPTSDSRRLESTANDNNAWRPMRILVHYLDEKDSSDLKLILLKKVVIPEAIKFLENTIQVKGPKIIQPFNSSLCDSEFEMPKKYKTDPTNADFIIFFGVYDQDDSQFASARYCLFSPYDQRPLVGVSAVNLRYLTTDGDKVRTHIKIIIHEILHALAFDQDLFDLFPNKQFSYVNITDSTTFDKRRVRITSPGILALGARHYGCPTYEGLEMENEGSQASVHAHFEKRFLGIELMTAEAVSEPVISEFALTFLNDSGWYLADLSKAEKLTFGASKGCGFIAATCSSSFSEFCTTEGASECTPDYSGVQVCAMSDYSNKCYLKQIVPELICRNNVFSDKNYFLGESFGQNSRCLTKSLNNVKVPGCFKSYCINANQLLVSINNTNVTCNSNTTTVTLQDITVHCPDLADFCSKAFPSRCKDNCNDRGVCNADGTCSCNYMYTGAACQEVRECSSDMGALCQALLQPTSLSENSERTFISLLTLIMAFVIY